MNHKKKPGSESNREEDRAYGDVCIRAVVREKVATSAEVRIVFTLDGRAERAPYQ